MFFRIVVIIFTLGLLSCGGSSGKTVLRFWHGIENPESNRLLSAKVEEFESQNPGIDIVLENIGAQDKAMPKIMTAVSSGQQPELLWFAPVYTGKIAESGKLRAAEDFFKSDGSFKKEDLYKGPLESGKYKGKIYTVPFEANCLAVYYNRKHFEQAGITKLPETWEEFKKTAQKLTIDKNSDNEPEQYGFLLPLGTEEWAVWTWQTFLWQSGGELLNKKRTELLFNRKAGVAALQFWIDLKYTAKCAMFSNRNAGYKLDPFLSGKVSMMINGSWNYPVLKNQRTIEYGVFKLPVKKMRATNIGGENLYIFKSDKKKEDAAWKFARYIMSEDFQVDWAIQTGYLPVNRQAAQSRKYRQFLEENPFIKTYVESMEFGKARPAITNYSQISKRIGRALEKALYKKVTPGQALDEAYRQSRGLL